MPSTILNVLQALSYPGLTVSLPAGPICILIIQVRTFRHKEMTLILRGCTTNKGVESGFKPWRLNSICYAPVISYCFIEDNHSILAGLISTGPEETGLAAWDGTLKMTGNLWAPVA